MQQLSVLIQKFTDQSATKAELHALLLLLDKEEEALQREWMKHADQKKEFPDRVFGQQKIRKAIIHKISATEASQLPHIKVARLYAIWGTMAAACISIFIILGILFKMNNNTEQDKVVENTLTQSKTLAFHAAAKDQHIILEDSSSVLLYKGSSLQYIGSYNTSDRQLLLNGNALFKVKKDSQRPFIVVTRQNTTTALGTVFEVKEWKDSTTVFLSEGRVKVHTATNESNVTFLEPGDQAITYQGHTLIAKNNFKDNSSIHISPGYHSSDSKEKKTALVFKQTPLTNVLATLEIKYHIKIQFNSEELSGLLFTGVINEEDRIEHVLAAIATIHNLAISTQDQDFSISK